MIQFEGEVLDWDDIVVFAALVHLARGTVLGEELPLSFPDICFQLGLKIGGATWARLSERLGRLRKASFRFSYEARRGKRLARITHTGPLLSSLRT